MMVDWPMGISGQGNSLSITSEGSKYCTTEKEVVNHSTEARRCSNRTLRNSAQLRKRRLSIKFDFQVVEIKLFFFSDAFSHVFL